MERRLAAILAADVVGYSRLMEADEAGTLAALKNRRKEILQPLVVKHRGRVVKIMGDGVLVEFASAVNAVQCAVELQEAMGAARVEPPEHPRIALRVGINLGDVIVEGNDLYGDGVNIAARLEAIAEPGSVYVSQTVFSHVRGKVKLDFQDLGEQTLKNMAEPVRVYKISGATASNVEAMRGNAVQTSQPSIAVLPFTNMSGDPEQEYFSDGITEDIITELSRYHSLLVMARNSCFQFRGSSIDIAAVRRALGVRYIVEGSVRKAGNRIRVTAQLIDAVTQSHLWAERYDRDFQDIFAVQDEVTRTVVAAVEGRVASSGAEHARRKPPTEWAAYECFLQGREHINRYRPAEAEPFFTRAIELDPNYVHAHAGRALALGDRYLHDEQQETIDAALSSAQRALALDENDAWAHQAMGFVALRRRQLELAGQHFDRAVSLNPNDVVIACERANYLTYAGQYDEALRSLDAARQRDPFPPNWVWETRGQALFCLQRFDEAIVAFRNVRPQYFWIPGLIAAAYAHKGQLDDARRELAIFQSAKPGVTLAWIAKRHMSQEMRTLVFDGLRSAGLPD